MSPELAPDEEQKPNCTMCRFVLYFAFGTLLLVLLFTYVFRLKSESPFLPLSKSEVPSPTVLDWDARIIDLGRTIHGPELDKALPALAAGMKPPTK